MRTALIVAAFWFGAAEAHAQTAPFHIVSECNARFVELEPQLEPATMSWGRFGDPIDSYYGVTAYSHGATGDVGRNNRAGLYQCTELVHRYLRAVFGVPSRLGMGLGNGVDLAQGVAERFGGGVYSGGGVAASVSPHFYPNGASDCRPLVGSVVSVSMPNPHRSSPGHVAIIRALNPDGDALVAIMFEQHGGASYPPDRVTRPGSIRFTRDAAGHWSGLYSAQWGGLYPVAGWTSMLAH